MQDDMQGHEVSIYNTNICRSSIKFPSITFLQMNNYVGDNKNLYVFAFLSL